MPASTILWHDYETFGISPALDRPAQFAGVRTDENLNVVDDPVVVYCQPSPDRLPSPEACLITRITPQIAQAKGVTEAAFIRQINAELGRPGTCGAGYNSIRFDDEFTRYTLYRNFMDPYAREWRDGCSRWDIIDLARMTYALRPEGIEWPLKESGDPSFRLELLTKANGISHESAHDALSDVYATIEFAKLLRTRQPKLYQWLFELRNKRKVADLIDIRSGKPILHTTRMYPSSNGCTSLVLPLEYETGNKNSVLAYDLRVDPEPFLDMETEQLKQCLFTRADDLPDGLQRLPIKSIKINKCPAIAPAVTLTDEVAERIGIDVAQCMRNREKLMQAKNFGELVERCFSERKFESINNVDAALYEGFIGDSDRKLADQIYQADGAELSEKRFSFKDKRLPELLFRYRARNWPESLSADEKDEWFEHCMMIYQDPDHGLEPFQTRIDTLKLSCENEADKIQVLDDLLQWGDDLLASVG